MNIKITALDVEDSAGSFEDWANATDPQTDEDVARWHEAYDEQVAAALSECYPHAAVEFGEGNEQLWGMKISFEYEEAGEGEESDYVISDYVITGLSHMIWGELEHRIRRDVGYILENVSNDGLFWAA